MDNRHYSNQSELDTHIKSYHKANPFSDYLQEIVYGGSDGIVTTLAVISGFAGAGSGNLELTTTVVLLFGLANLFGDAASMGLGNFLSVRSEKAVAQKQITRQIQELESDPEKSRQATKFLLIKKGYTEQDAQTLSNLLMKNKKHWLEFTLNEEIGVGDSFKENSYISSLFTFFAFIVFGFLPIIPFLTPFWGQQFAGSVCFAVAALCILGGTRKVVTGETWMKAVGETLFVGGVSSSIAYIVGILVG